MTTTEEPASFPASSAQRRLLLIEQLNPGTPAYNIPFAVRLAGVLDTTALRAALTLVVERHETLRTTFGIENGDMVQIIGTEADPHLEEVDLAGTPLAAAADDFTAMLGERAMSPFDLSTAAIRCTLYRLEPQLHVLAITMHHLVSDMWSCGILIRELSTAYTALRAGVQPELPELPLQYLDYAMWQEEQLADPEMTAHGEYWKGRLAGLPTLLEVPADRARPAVQSFRGAALPVRLSAATSRAVLGASRRLDATPYMTMLAAFQATIGRLASRDDVVTCTGVATRPGQVEDLIGCFINIVLFRTSLAGDPTFEDLVGRVRTAVLEAFEHQDFPFERLVSELAPERDLSYQPLSQVMFVLQNAPMPMASFGDLTTAAQHVPRHTTQLDVDLQLWDAGGWYEGFIEYATDLYDHETIARLWHRFETFIEAALADPAGRVSSLPVLSGAEITEQVAHWNDTAASAPADTIPQLVESVVRAQPEAIAVRAPSRDLTYAQVWEQAARVAAGLRDVGVGPESVVGLYLGRTVERVVGMLGILIAGGAYLPLDPEYPDDRLRFMLDDAAPVAIVTQTAVATSVPAGERPVICVDGPLPAGIDTVPSHPSNLAYIIYTSGSTGRPKGIAVAHLGVVNNIADLNRVGRVGAGDGVLGLSSLSFDMSVYEVLGMLMAGATVVLPDEELARDREHWLDLIDRYQVTVWNSAPSLLVELASAAESTGRRLSPLRVAFLGGDWIPVTLPDRVRALAPGLDFISLGGATEASIHSTVYRVGEVDPVWTSIPYGRPMENQQALILEPSGAVAPIGVVSELYLGGDGLTRGYLNRPSLTAQRYVPHGYAGRFANVPQGARLYRTGDLARYAHDGLIELIGRVDHQVKIRGHRIELDEITEALRRHPAVADAVVVADRRGAAEAGLVAFWVPATDDDPDLRAYLRARLPDYMVPVSFAAIECIPLSPNGKVDRRALRLEDAVTAARTQYVEPRDALEAALADVWCAVLGQPRVGVEDNFFALGGDSLHSSRIAALAREALGMDITLRAMLQAPTIAAQAAMLREQATASGMDIEAAAEIARLVWGMTDEAASSMLAAHKEE